MKLGTWFNDNAATMTAVLHLARDLFAELQPGGFFHVDRPVGQYSAASPTETEKTLSFSLDAGETEYLRTAVWFGVLACCINPILETLELANKEVPSLSFAGEATAAN